jgi:hypothetical protein
MTKRPSINTLTNTASPTYLTQLNQNFTNVKTQFDNTLSLDGSLPNAMNADLDLNGNDLINGGTLSADDIVIGGTSIATQVTNAAASATSAATSASASAASATTATAYTPAYFDNFTALKADTRTWPVGQLLNTRAEGFAYQVVSSGQHLTTTGGVKLIVLPGDVGYNVMAFGAVGDGTADDTTAIQVAFSSSAQRIFIPDGTYKITASLTLDGNKCVEGAGSNVGMSTIRLENNAILEVVKVGSNSMFGGSIKNIVTDRVTYSGATENIGWAFYDMAGCVIESITSRLSKYNFYFKPGTGQRVAYNTFINISGVGGFYNMAGALSGTGFVNENVFLGGRMFTTANTNTNVYFDFSNNHNRWVAMSCEGSGSQAFYIEGTALLNSHSNVVWNCRTEGTWSVDDVVLGTNTQRNTVDCRSLYTTVTDNGNNNSIFTSTLNKFSTGDNNSKTMVVERIGASTSSSPALTVSDQYPTSGDSFGILVESGRDTATGYIIKGQRKSDGLDRFHVTSQGSLYASINLEAGQSSWNFSPLKLGNYVLWVDSTGDLRIKNGVPTSDTDGTVVGTQS